jgi:hypothetical protein
MIAVDVERSAGRGNVAQRKVREALFTALREACTQSDIEWADCHRSDRGDGMVLVGPHNMQKSRFIYPFADDLAHRLRAHNKMAGPRVQIRIRMAVHAGDVYVDDGTVAGSPFEFLARMLDAPPVKEGLAAAPNATTVGLVVSPHIHDDVIRHDYVGIDPQTFRRIEFTVKETTGIAWLQLPADCHIEPAPQPPSPAPTSANPQFTQTNTALIGDVFAVQGGNQTVYREGSR